MSDKYDILRLKNQICFPLYVCSKEIVRGYKPFLDRLDLTYTQYITMMVMWEEQQISVRDLGKKLYLDSGTLTPVLKALEKKGYVMRARSQEDERVLIVTATESGMALRDEALEVPGQMRGCIDISDKDAAKLYKLLRKLMKNF